jgi:hypothetical protein
MKDYFKVIGFILGTLIIFSIIGFGFRACNKAEEATHLKDAVIVYEEFQEIYNTCSKLNTDLCNMKALDEKDVMFEQFSKAQRVNTIKTQLNRWVEDYNAKSKMFGRSLWKSNQLPYQLTNEQFSCNN